MKSPSSPFMLQEPYRPRWCACHVEPVLEKKPLCPGYWADWVPRRRFFLELEAWGQGSGGAFHWHGDNPHHLHLPKNQKTWNTNIHADMDQFPEETKAHKAPTDGGVEVLPHHLFIHPLSIPFLFIRRVILVYTIKRKAVSCWHSILNYNIIINFILFSIPQILSFLDGNWWAFS